MKYDESANPEYGRRLLRGHQMIEDGISPKQIAETRFEIPSATRDVTYIVSKFYKKMDMHLPGPSVPANSLQTYPCSFIWQKLTAKLQEEEKAKVVIDKPISIEA